ncbi:MAG TPA: L-threonylcarbamoyladenylate synthase [Armatimonadota bacterium]|nr:L-threonylcarbamoyladenylate synthase [Armatimonadota bacterium]
MIETQVLRVDPAEPAGAALRQAAALIGAGDLVAFPTDTVYGIGCRPDDARAVAAVYEAKGRPRRVPLVLFITAADRLGRYVAAMTPALELAARHFWPGPLTIVARAREDAPAALVSQGTIGIRIPRHPLALRLVDECGGALATTSANLSGRGSTGDPQVVWSQLTGRIALLLDAGRTRGGVESTVVDFTAHPPAILRAGAIGADELSAVIGRLGK